MVIKYIVPIRWIQYDQNEILSPLVEAKAAIQSLKTMPVQRSWVEHLQQVQLKREVAGTSRIEGAEFTDQELDEAIRKEAPDELFTRSQRQANTAVRTYRWIAALEDHRPITQDLILETHRRIITGADDDHCPPGRIRRLDENVTFGAPRHRGAEGGSECAKVFGELSSKLSSEYRDHDQIVQAFALHYHFAAIHPFLDGNGRTARALEALMLQREGLRDSLFIAMSNYYYDEKNSYLRALSESRAHEHELTPFLKFCLKGVTLQCRRLSEEIRKHVSKALYRNLMYELFNRLETKRKRVIKERQIGILKLLLRHDELEFVELSRAMMPSYSDLKNTSKAFARDLSHLSYLGAISIEKGGPENKDLYLRPRLEWPQEITETEFIRRVNEFPKAKTHPFL